MTTTNENGLTIVRHETDRLITVYRAGQPLGLIYPPLPDAEWRTFDAKPLFPLCERLPDAPFDTEAAAIAYLAA